MLKQVQHDDQGEKDMTHSDNGFFDSFGGKYVAEVLASTEKPLPSVAVAIAPSKKP